MIVCFGQNYVEIKFMLHRSNFLHKSCGMSIHDLIGGVVIASYPLATSHAIIRYKLL